MCDGKNLQIAFVRETFALFSGRVAGFVEELLELHDLSLGEAFPGSFDFVSWDGRGGRIVGSDARDGAGARQGGVHGWPLWETVGVAVWEKVEDAADGGRDQLGFDRLNTVT